MTVEYYYVDIYIHTIGELDKYNMGVDIATLIIENASGQVEKVVIGCFQILCLKEENKRRRVPKSDISPKVPIWYQKAY